MAQKLPLNTIVKVRLTPRGRQIIDAHARSLALTVRRSAEPRYVKAGRDGYVEFSLAALMSNFGAYLDDYESVFVGDVILLPDASPSTQRSDSDDAN